MREPVTRDEVLAHADELPAFPRIVAQILATLDDPDASLHLLADHIKHDPIITARVLAMANTAATHTRRLSTVRDVFTATSLIGLGRVRQTTLATRLGDFVAGCTGKGHGASFWQHSLAVGICAEELSGHLALRAPGELAFIAGVLHDVGQLWLSRVRPDGFAETWRDALSHSVGIDSAERAHFGVDHGTVGAWLAEHWSLPPEVADAIGHHHDPGAGQEALLVPLLHVAEVLSNALDLGERKENRVISVSSAACSRLGLVWDDSVRPLFGRIDARSAHACQIFAIREG